jgi:hypothetical protein
VKVDSEKTNIIDDAIFDVQTHLSLIEKNSAAAVKGSETEKNRYATSAHLYEVIHPLAVGAGIMIWQGGEEGARGERLVTVLAKGGQQRVSSFPILAREGAQNFGGGLAFAKRWGLQAAFGVFTADNKDERNAGGYEPQRPGRRAPAPVGLPAALQAIRDANDTQRVESASTAARGAFPRGEDGNAVEREISAWYKAAFEGCNTADRLIALRASANTVRPKSSEVRDAIAAAEARMKGGAS